MEHSLLTLAAKAVPLKDLYKAPEGLIDDVHFQLEEQLMELETAKRDLECELFQKKTERTALVQHKLKTNLNVSELQECIGDIGNEISRIWCFRESALDPEWNAYFECLYRTCTPGYQFHDNCDPESLYLSIRSSRDLRDSLDRPSGGVPDIFMYMNDLFDLYWSMVNEFVTTYSFDYKLWQANVMELNKECYRLDQKLEKVTNDLKTVQNGYHKMRHINMFL